MTVLEFLRTADENEIAGFIQDILWGCECGVGDCPLTMVSDINMDNFYYSCDHECIMKFLQSGVKKR